MSSNKPSPETSYPRSEADLKLGKDLQPLSSNRLPAEESYRRSEADRREEKHLQALSSNRLPAEESYRRSEADRRKKKDLQPMSSNKLSPEMSYRRNEADRMMIKGLHERPKRNGPRKKTRLQSEVDPKKKPLLPQITRKRKRWNQRSVLQRPYIRVEEEMRYPSSEEELLRELSLLGSFSQQTCPRRIQQRREAGRRKGRKWRRVSKLKPRQWRIYRWRCWNVGIRCWCWNWIPSRLLARGLLATHFCII